MTDLIITVGWLGLGLGLVYAFFLGRSAEGDITHIHNVQRILMISGSVLVSGYLLKFLGVRLHLGSGRCKTCGKRVNKHEMFCFDHRIEKIRNAQELDRTGEVKRR